MTESLPIQDEATFQKLCESFERNETDSPISQKQIESFLKQSELCGGSSSEKLRQLAIHLESTALAEGWEDLRKIYDYASKINPKDALLYLSWGIAAGERCQEWWTENPIEQNAVVQDGVTALLRALLLAPKNAEVAYTLGTLYYNHPSVNEDPERLLSEATLWFEHALRWHPDHTMAQLHLAHCFQDGKLWDKAIEAYEQVNTEDLSKLDSPWRLHKRDEQLICCHMMADNDHKATMLCEKFLTKLESWDEVTLQQSIVDLDELVAIIHYFPTSTFSKRLHSLIEKAGWTERYSELFAQVEVKS